MPNELRKHSIKRRSSFKRGMVAANENSDGGKPEFIEGQSGPRCFWYSVPSPAGMPVYVYAGVGENYEIMPLAARILSRGSIMIPTGFLKWNKSRSYLVVDVDKPATNLREAEIQFEEWIWKTFPPFHWTPVMINMPYV